MKYCSNRQNDNWSEDVKRKVLSCNDLVHAEAKYQDDCRKLFTNPKYNEASLLRLAGRPRKEIEQDNFIRFCEWWKGEEDSFSVVELHKKKMKELAKSNEVYSLKCFQQKLIDKYKGLIYFSDAEGKPNALCFNDWLNSLLNDQWC